MTAHALKTTGSLAEPAMGTGSDVTTSRGENHERIVPVEFCMLLAYRKTTYLPLP